MQAEDYDKFAAVLEATFDVIGKSTAAKMVSPAAKALFFSDMKRYPLELVISALAAHRADGDRGKFTPTPADLNYQIDQHTKRDTRPGAEEAWALSLTSQDPQNTVVWTQECAEAFELSRPVLESSGTMSARKTFIEIYGRLVSEARKNRRQVYWFQSPGLNKSLQQEVLKQAVDAGLIRLPPPEEPKQLEAPKGMQVISRTPKEQMEFIQKMILEGSAAKQARLDAAQDARVKAIIEYNENLHVTSDTKVAEYMADNQMVEKLEKEQVRRAADGEY